MKEDNIVQPCQVLLSDIMLDKSLKIMDGTVILTEERRKKYTCYICLSKFCAISDLNNHKALCHVDEVNDGENGSKDSEKDSDYREDESDDSESETDDDTLENDLCIGKSKNPSISIPFANCIKDSIDISQNSPFNCNSCKFTFTTLHELRTHKPVTNKCVFSCKLCSRLFNTSNVFLVHVMHHRVNFYCFKFFNCEKCDTVFGNYFQLKKHEILCHTIKSEPTNSSVQPQSHSGTIKLDTTVENCGNIVPKVELPDSDEPETVNNPSEISCELCYDVCNSEEDFISHMEFHRQLEIEEDDIEIIENNSQKVIVLDDSDVEVIEDQDDTRKSSSCALNATDVSNKGNKSKLGLINVRKFSAIKSHNLLEKKSQKPKSFTCKRNLKVVHILPKPSDNTNPKKITSQKNSLPVTAGSCVIQKNDTTVVNKPQGSSVVSNSITQSNNQRNSSNRKDGNINSNNVAGNFVSLPTTISGYIIQNNSENVTNNSGSCNITNQTVSLPTTTPGFITIKPKESNFNEKLSSAPKLTKYECKNKKLIVSKQKESNHHQIPSIKNSVTKSTTAVNTVAENSSVQVPCALSMLTNESQTNQRLLCSLSDNSQQQISSVSSTLTNDSKNNQHLILSNVQNLSSASTHSFIAPSSTTQNISNNFASTWTNSNLVANPNLVYVMNPVNNSTLLSGLPTETPPAYVNDSSNIAYFIVPTNSAENIVNSNFASQNSQTAKLTFSESSQYLRQVNQINTFAISEQNNMVCTLPSPLGIVAPKNTQQFPNLSMPLVSNSSDNIYFIANQSNKTVITQNTLVQILPKQGP